MGNAATKANRKLLKRISSKMAYKNQIIGIIAPTKAIFNQYIRERLPLHREIAYKRITNEKDLTGRFTKIINGYEYHLVSLEIRVKAYKIGNINYQ